MIPGTIWYRVPGTTWQLAPITTYTASISYAECTYHVTIAASSWQKQLPAAAQVGYQVPLVLCYLVHDLQFAVVVGASCQLPATARMSSTQSPTKSSKKPSPNDGYYLWIKGVVNDVTTKTFSNRDQRPPGGCGKACNVEIPGTT